MCFHRVSASHTGFSLLSPFVKYLCHSGSRLWVKLRTASGFLATPSPSSTMSSRNIPSDKVSLVTCSNMSTAPFFFLLYPLHSHNFRLLLDINHVVLFYIFVLLFSKLWSLDHQCKIIIRSTRCLFVSCMIATFSD